jgi:L-2-hydroxyglutarate oxidase
MLIFVVKIFYMALDVIIVGGGIVGLATAHRLLEQKPDLKIALFEKENMVSMHQTGNNSGVIHSGLYYKPGSLKAKNCIDGYHQLIEFCQTHDIPFELTGKIVVASTEEQKPLLQNLYVRGQENGLDGIKKITLEEMREHEPHVAGVEGLWVPQTGIVDYRQVAAKLAVINESKGLDIHLGEQVIGITKGQTLSIVETTRGTYETKLVINCAGLYSDKVAQMSQREPLDVRIIPFRGEYYKLRADKEYLVKNLIYPVPDPNFPFLGVHFTRMKKGGVEAGPNAVLAFRKEGYKKLAVDFKELWETLSWPGFQKVATKYYETGLGEMYRSFSKAAFTKALQVLIPEIQESDLVEGGAGVRAQACDRNGGLLDDFSIVEDAKVINILNAPSPAATSSLSIGKTVATMALNRF